MTDQRENQNEEATSDGFLDNGFVVYQPKKRAHRSGLDAILLAAVVPQAFSGRIADLGAGCGVAGMAVAHRCAEAQVDLIEIDARTCDLALKSIGHPKNTKIQSRLSLIETDVTDRSPGSVLEKGAYAHVIANPPYNPAQMQSSPNEDRARAHVMTDNLLTEWIISATLISRHNARLTLILRPENLTEALNAFRNRFGAVNMLPIHTKAMDPANRIIVDAIKGARRSLQILPPFTVHADDGAFSNKAEEILRGRAGLFIR